MNSRSLIFLPVLGLAALSFAGCSSKPESKPASNVVAAPDTSKQMAAPNWELKDLDGKTVKLSDFKGKVVILDFWATWCPPCRAEIPDFIDLQKQYGNQGLAIVGVSLDEGGPHVVSDFVQKQGMNYTVVMGTPDVASAYGGIQGIPTTFVIDRHGMITDHYVGETGKSVFEDDIKKLLPQ